MIRLEFGAVLCAGVGVRLRPLTDVLPKPVLSFLDRPIAGYALDALHATGAGRVGVNAHPMPGAMDALLRAKAAEWGLEGATPPLMTLVVESELLGTGGGARGIYEQLGSPSSTVAVLNGDVVADFPLEAMLKVHRRTGAVATMLMLPTVVGEAAVWLDASERFVTQLPAPDGDWTSSRYTPAIPATFGGVYLLESEVFERLPTETSCLIRHGVGPLLPEGAIVAAHRFDGFWADLGTPRRFLDATMTVLDNPDLLPASPMRHRSDGVYVADRRVLPRDVELQGPVYVAGDAVVEPGVTLGPYAVVGGGCTVRAGARVSESVLMAGAIVSGECSRRVVCGEAVARVT